MLCKTGWDLVVSQTSTVRFTPWESSFCHYFHYWRAHQTGKNEYNLNTLSLNLQFRFNSQPIRTQQSAVYFQLRTNSRTKRQLRRQDSSTWLMLVRLDEHALHTGWFESTTTSEPTWRMWTITRWQFAVQFKIWNMRDNWLARHCRMLWHFESTQPCSLLSHYNEPVGRVAGIAEINVQSSWHSNCGVK